MIKKRSKLMLVMSMLLVMLCMTSIVYANDNAEEYSIKVFNDNNVIEFENKPFFYEHSVYVPLRELMGKLSIPADEKNQILWDNGKVLIYLDGHMDFYEINIGENLIWYDAKEPAINAKGFSEYKNAPILMNSTTYIPFEYISAIFNRFDHYYDVSYTFGNINSKSAYLNNAEGLTYSQISELQYTVDRKMADGVSQSRLTPTELIKEYFSTDKATMNGEISDFAGDGLNCAGTYTVNGVSYHIELFKPVQKDELGIWVVRTVQEKE